MFPTVGIYLRSGPTRKTTKLNIVSFLREPDIRLVKTQTLCLFARFLARKNVLASTPPENFKSFPVGKNSEIRRIFIFCLFFDDSSQKNEKNFGGQVV